MIYIIEIRRFSNPSWYTCFESNTESVFDGSTEDLIRWLSKHEKCIENMKLLNNRIVTGNSFEELHSVSNSKATGSEYILLGKVASDKFKMVNYKGEIIYTRKSQLHRYIDTRKIANCRKEDGKIVYTNTTDTQKDTELEAEIAEKYKIYVAKSALLGIKMSFDYTIEGNQVKLKRYTGKSQTVIIPKFVTTIMDRAFLDVSIDTLTLSNGLKYIGGFAFSGCGISEVTIPDTVEIICKNAFTDNRKLTTRDGVYTKNIKVLNKETMIID